MRKYILLFWMSWWVLVTFGQTQLYRGKIVDAETGEAMPSTTLYISSGNGVITNVDGYFVLNATPSDMVRISFVGYSTMNVKASELQAVIKMQPLSSVLQEVTVLGTDAILQKVKDRLAIDYKKHKQKKAHYFTRITMMFSEQTEMIEAFLEVSSAVNLRQIGVTNGRYWAESKNEKFQSSLDETNVHLFYCLGPLVRGDEGWINFLKYPFAGSNIITNIHRYYDVSQSILYDSNNHSVYCFELTPKREEQNIYILGGKIYVDSETFQLLMFEGTLHHMPVKHTHNGQKEGVYLDIKLHIDYQHKNGFTEVKNITCTATNDDIACQMSMVNVEDHHFQYTYAKRIGDNMLDAILTAGSNPEIEDKFTFIQRTDRELNLIRDDK